MKKIVVLILALFIVSCAAPINRKSSINYAITAQAALQKNDWNTARKYWAKAVVNAELGNSNPKRLAALSYEYGRALGVNCFFSESETYLKKSYDLDSTNSGPAHMSLLELARLNYDQKKYKEAAFYFEKLIPIYDKFNAEAKDPTGVALVFKEYSNALSSIDKKTKATTFSQRASELEKIGNKSNTERTPYGTQCVG